MITILKCLLGLFTLVCVIFVFLVFAIISMVYWDAGWLGFSIAIIGAGSWLAATNSMWADWTCWK